MTAPPQANRWSVASPLGRHQPPQAKPRFLEPAPRPLPRPTPWRSASWWPPPYPDMASYEMTRDSGGCVPFLAEGHRGGLCSSHGDEHPKHGWPRPSFQGPRICICKDRVCVCKKARPRPSLPCLFFSVLFRFCFGLVCFWVSLWQNRKAFPTATDEEPSGSI